MSGPPQTTARGLTISQLEARSGVRRSVIYYYVHLGLLPPAQKASPTRALYTDRHVTLLEAIAGLKHEGLSLEQIRERLAERIDTSVAGEVDLVADEERRRRDVILEEAARQFAAKGYRLTRIADICEALGIAPRALYDHFPTKQALFVACYHVYADWLAADVEPHVEEERDPAARLIWRMRASAAIQAFGPDLQALAQAASVHDDGELQEMTQETYRVITERAEADLAAVRDPGGGGALLGGARGDGPAGRVRAHAHARRVGRRVRPARRDADAPRAVPRARGGAGRPARHQRPAGRGRAAAGRGEPAAAARPAAG